MAFATVLRATEPPPYIDAGLASVPNLLSICMSSQATGRGTQQTTDILSRPPRTTTQSWSPLLLLPLEIRLQIYDWVFLGTPIQERRPCEGYPLPDLSRRTQTELVEPEKDVGGTIRGQTSGLGTLRATQSYCYISSGLLRVNRQIYTEARHVPFNNNEFVYRNWFSSGLVKASIIVGEIFQRWQRDAMRSARVETTLSDFHHESGLRAWEHLSDAWKNGLRHLTIVIQVCKEQTAKAGTTKLNNLIGEPGVWALHGHLSSMRALERLDIQLDVPACPKSEKLAWCAELQASLLQQGSKAIVACVQDLQVGKL